ncbi:hypothetical protein GCM10018790_81020 [Kitasatospora xanthocidica]|uniref:AAA family ATPase n=1 Tax=Kitasatospora xanthocidica TaxID=83382 RepID=UPI001674C7FE|nr:AAA family ATPase [Kitasatospora xanthocidica]GHF91713.1 hypothetical protein GCM10018790_81020 [Kitasatospora xanthocidica]
MTVLWINGPFGGGKTTQATNLLRELPGSVVFDPEKVGCILRETFPGKRRDFQDFPAWRPLVAECVIRVHEENEGRPVVVPMTLLNREYASEIHDRIRSAGAPLVHLLLHAEPGAISTRVEGSMEYPGDEERSEKVRVFRRKKAPVYAEAHQQWLGAQAEVIDTTHLAPAQVTEQALKIIGELRAPPQRQWPPPRGLAAHRPAEARPGPRRPPERHRPPAAPHPRSQDARAARARTSCILRRPPALVIMSARLSATSRCPRCPESGARAVGRSPERTRRQRR